MTYYIELHYADGTKLVSSGPKELIDRIENNTRAISWRRWRDHE